MCSLCFCADAPLAISCAVPHTASVSDPACQLCGRRLRSVKHHRPHGIGRACHPACKPQKGGVDVTADAVRPPVSSHSRASLTVPTTAEATARQKRPYDTLGPTQQWKRRKEASAAVSHVLEQVGCPMEAVVPAATPSPADVLHLSTAERDRVRTVPHIHIPAERTIIKCKKQLAVTHATETATFANGAYLTDPIRFVTGLCLQSSMLAVGGDTGDQLTKLGVTYVDGKHQRFAALLVFRGSDKYDDLETLQADGLTPFKGESQHLGSIFNVLQRIIDLMKAFLNGDWPFINTVLGLKNASATHPCPICCISSTNLLGTAQYRKPQHSHSRNHNHDRLLTIDSERIVPTPLHLFLGISNRIILEVFAELFTTELVETTLEQVKQVKPSILPAVVVRVTSFNSMDPRSASG